MNDYRHHVSGFFANRVDAERALSLLLGRGLPRERLYLLDAESVKSLPEPKEDSNAVLKDVLVDGAIGTAVGTGLGALAQVALVAGSTTLFIASPLLAPLAMLGWGASIGAIVGAGVGATAGGGNKTGPLGDLVHDAIVSGQVVLVAETRSEQETAIAREVIGGEVGDYTDLLAEG